MDLLIVRKQVIEPLKVEVTSLAAVGNNASMLLVAMIIQTQQAPVVLVAVLADDGGVGHFGRSCYQLSLPGWSAVLILRKI